MHEQRVLTIPIRCKGYDLLNMLLLWCNRAGPWHVNVVKREFEVPDSEPTPSSTDSEYAFPGWVYWISPIFKGRAGEPRAWLRAEDASSWPEIEIVTR